METKSEVGIRKYEVRVRKSEIKGNQCIYCGKLSGVTLKFHASIRFPLLWLLVFFVAISLFFRIPRDVAAPRIRYSLHPLPPAPFFPHLSIRRFNSAGE